MTEKLTRNEGVLAAAVREVLSLEFRSADDLLEYVEIAQIAKALTSDQLGTLLEKTTGMRIDIGREMHPDTAHAVLAGAHGNGLITAKQIFEAIPLHVQVKQFPPLALWNFIAESEFWKTEKSHSKFRDAQQVMIGLIQAALTVDLITPTTLVRGPMADELTEHLPHELQVAMMRHLLKGLDDTTLFNNVIHGHPVILEHVPLSSVWSHVVVGHILPAITVGGSSLAPQGTSAAPKH